MEQQRDGPQQDLQLEPQRPLAGDDRRVVERMDERQPALGRALQRALDALVDAAA